MKKKNIRLSWDEWYEFANEYYRCFGNLLVPRSYKTKEGYALGRWIERQRAMYNGIILSTLDTPKTLALQKIGMVWKLENRYDWNTWLNQLMLYQKTYGDCCVPHEYSVDGYSLGNWVATQRKKYTKGLLTQEQIKDLESCGVQWSDRSRRPWQEWYEDAERYYAAYGNLLVPFSYVTENGDMLGQWIATQRQRKHGDVYHTMLTKKQEQQLEQIGMVWNLDGVRSNAWNEMYAYVKNYATENGRLPLWPRDMVTLDGRNVPNWVGVQRTRLSENKCSERERALLYSIGIYGWKAINEKSSTNVI